MIFISFTDVKTLTGNHLREVQMLSLLSRKHSITYFNINSRIKDIYNYKVRNNLEFEIFAISSIYSKYIRTIFKLNYLINYFLCSRLKLYQNFKFYFRNEVKKINAYPEIFCFYSIPFHFLKIKKNRNSKILIDTNDIMLNRHKTIGTNRWWSFSKKTEMSILQQNTKLIYISVNDQLHYRTFLNIDHSCDLIPFFLPSKRINKKSVKTPICIGFIGSNNPFNLFSFYELQEISKNYPQFKFIIGGSITNRIKDIAQENIFSFPDKNLSKNYLADFYEQIDVVYAPAHNISGIKTKIIESLSYGIPVLTNENGNDESLEIFRNNGLYILKSKNDFDSHVNKAIQSNPKRPYKQYVEQIENRIYEIDL